MQKRTLSLVFECMVGKFERLHERLLFTLHGRINCQPTSESFALPENAARKSNKLNGLKAAVRRSMHEGRLWAKSDYSNSTASLNCSALTSMYLCVVDICECPASPASKRTPTPLLANLVM